SLYTPFSCSLYRVHRCLPSFPTRRSSDLAAFCISGSMVSMMFCLLLSNQGDDLTGPGGHNIEWLADRVLLGHFPRPVRPPELDVTPGTDDRSNGRHHHARQLRRKSDPPREPPLHPQC